ncbi:MAG: hypothetical protein R3F59_14545 [Myxococcota bacterium]
MLALGLQATIVTPPMPALAPSHRPVPLEDEAEALASLAELDTDHDVIVALNPLRPVGVQEAARQLASDRGVLELAFLLARERIAALRAGEAELWSLCVGGVDGGVLHPGTGPLAGLLKSVARELPEARVRAVVTDERPLAEAFAAL